MKKKRKKIRKVYCTNKDTISLNCDEFSPGWMRPSNSSFDPRLVVGLGLKNKKESGAQKLRNKVNAIRRKLKQVRQANSSCLGSRIIAADREIERFHRFFKGIA